MPKPMSLFIALAVMATSLTASAMPTEDFLRTFIDATNTRLEKVNKLRSEQGKKLYCQALSEKQINHIFKQLLSGYDAKEGKPTFSLLEKVTVQQFVENVASYLECYPLACPSQKQGLFGAICNAKAYNMDISLIEDVLEDVAGRDVQWYEWLATVVDKR